MSDGEALSLLGLQIVTILINQVLHVTTDYFYSFWLSALWSVARCKGLLIRQRTVIRPSYLLD